MRQGFGEFKIVANQIGGVGLRCGRASAHMIDGRDVFELIQTVGKRIAFQIIGKFEWCEVLPLFVFAQQIGDNEYLSPLAGSAPKSERCQSGRRRR